MITHCTHSECRSLHDHPWLAASLSALHNEVRFSFRQPPSPSATIPLCLFCYLDKTTKPFSLSQQLTFPLTFPISLMHPTTHT